MSSHARQLRVTESIQITHKNATCRQNTGKGVLPGLQFKTIIAFVGNAHPIIRILLLLLLLLRIKHRLYKELSGKFRVTSALIPGDLLSRRRGSR